jgi:hypothetical protein
MNCASIDISATGIKQLGGSRAMAAVRREDIGRIVLGHDSRSRHPFLRFLVGFVLVTSGIILAIGAFLLDLGGVYLVKMESFTFGIPVAPLVIVLFIWAGGWLVLGVLRGRYNLLIHTPQGTRKIYFAETADIRDIRKFLERAEQELGYEIDVSLMQQMHF